MKKEYVSELEEVNFKIVRISVVFAEKTPKCHFIQQTDIQIYPHYFVIYVEDDVPRQIIIKFQNWMCFT